MEKQYKTIGCIGRWKPLHLGGAALLRSLCKCSEKVIIGIGSVNRYNVRNPFTAEETEDMIRVHLSLYDNYSIVHIKDYGHIPENKDHDLWIRDIKEAFGVIDAFVSSNPYVIDLLKDIYKVIPAVSFIKGKRYAEINATKVRYLMAKGDSWTELVPVSISSYILSKGLDKRFRKEFGSEVLARGLDGITSQTIENEKNNILQE